VNKGDRFGDFRAEDYANYLCIAVDRERRALVMSDTYLRPGMQCQLMRRHMDFIDIRKHADALVESVRGKRPLLALYINCAGRASTYAGTEREDAADVQ